MAEAADAGMPLLKQTPESEAFGGGVVKNQFRADGR
jgi:hypothetical protein